MLFVIAVKIDESRPMTLMCIIAEARIIGKLQLFSPACQKSVPESSSQNYKSVKVFYVAHIRSKYSFLKCINTT